MLLFISFTIAAITSALFYIYQSSFLSPMSLKVAPVWTLSHGSPMSLFETDHPAHQHWISVGKKIRSLQPNGIVIVSAHWQAEFNLQKSLDDGKKFIQINTNQSNPLIFDFYNFPKHYYDATFPTKNPAFLSQNVIQQLKLNGYEVQQVDRGIDHGVWVPLKSAFGESLEIPLVQVSLPIDRDAMTDSKACLELGKALRPLREQGFLIIGSGQAVHNLRDFFTHTPGAENTYGKTFPPALFQAMTEVSKEEDQIQAEQSRWKSALDLLNRDDYKRAHPTPEHLLRKLMMKKMTQTHFLTIPLSHF